MTAAEASEWRRLNLRLTFYLETREQTLKALKMQREELKSEAAQPAWEGFSRRPAASRSCHRVNLYAHIYALRGEIGTLELRRELLEASLGSFLKAQQASEQQLRQAEELLSRSIGRPGETSARGRRELARLRNQVNGEGALAEEATRTLTAERIQAKRDAARSLEGQYHAAEAASPMTREELDRVLAEIDVKRKELEKLLAASILEQKSARAALEAPHRQGENQRPRRADPAGYRRQQDRDLPGVPEGLLLRGGPLAGYGYRLGRDEGQKTLRRKRAEADKLLREIRSLKESFGNTYMALTPLVQSETSRLRAGTVPEAEKAAVAGADRRLPGAPGPLEPGSSGS